MTTQRTIGALTLALLFSAGVASAQTIDPAAATTVNTTHSGATSVNITISNGLFSPHNVVIAPGTTVRWTNADTAQHSIIADNGSFQTGAITSGGTYTRVFSDAGTYLYYDSAAGAVGGKGMFGIIVVLPAGSTAASAVSNSSNLPGLPNTGSGGDAMKNILMLALSGLIVAVGTRAFLRTM